MAKYKELLACLADRQGSSMRYIYIRVLRQTLKEYGIERILEMQAGSLRVIPEQFVCDAYLFFRAAAIGSMRTGESIRPTLVYSPRRPFASASASSFSCSAKRFAGSYQTGAATRN